MSRLKKPRKRKSSRKGKGLTTSRRKAGQGAQGKGRKASGESAALLLNPRLQQKVMGYLRQEKGRAIGVNEIGRTFELDVVQVRHVRQFLKAQAKAGLLEARRRGRYILRDVPAAMERKAREHHNTATLTKQRARKERPPRDEPEGEDSLSVLEVEEFPHDVLAQAAASASDDLSALVEQRLDLRDVDLFTIDGADAKDFDDAVGYVSLADDDGKGLHRVIVAIADVAHYVEEGTALDDEALRRATSVYLPGICYPMLPEALSNGACSLRPNEERLSMVAFLDYDASFKIVATSFHEAIIESKARFTYDQVATVLDDMAPDGKLQTYRLRGKIAGLEGLEDSLWMLDQVSSALRSKRFRRGAMDLDMPEPKFIFDDDGNVEGIGRYHRNRAHFLIEELMLQANEAVASFLLSRDLPGVFRNHGTPDPEKLEQLMELLSHFGINPPPLRSKGKKRKHEEDDDWDISPTFFSTLAEAFGDHPAKRLFQFWLLRCMQQATYDAENYGHFGLSLEQYLHFTSPIRRYPDLCVHRSLKKYLRGEMDSVEKARLRNVFEEQASHSSIRERMAMKAERDAISQRKAEYLAQHVGEEADGVITSVAPFGFFVELDEHFVEGLVHARTFQGSFFFDETHLMLVHKVTHERFQLGDRLRVLIENVSLERGEIDFRVIERLAHLEDASTEA